MTEEEIKRKVQMFSPTSHIRINEVHDLIVLIKETLAERTSIDPITGEVKPADLVEVARVLASSPAMQTAAMRIVHHHEMQWLDSERLDAMKRLDDEFDRACREITGEPHLTYGGFHPDVDQGL